jgi:hypothetical protein
MANAESAQFNPQERNEVAPDSFVPEVDAAVDELSTAEAAEFTQETGAPERITDVIDDESDKGKIRTKHHNDKEYFDENWGTWRVKSPGYTHEDAYTDPVTKKYELGVNRRRIGAGFGRRRAPVVIEGDKPHLKGTIFDPDYALKPHPSLAAKIKRMFVPAYKKDIVLTPDNARKFYREFMGLKHGPTMYLKNNDKGQAFRPGRSLKEFTGKTLGSIHIPAGWCVQLYSRKKWQGTASKKWCGPRTLKNMWHHTYTETWGYHKTRSKVLQWIFHTGSILLTKFEYQAEPVPQDSKCPDYCGYKGGVITGEITCWRRHGGLKRKKVSMSKCKEVGLTKIAPTTKKCKPKNCGGQCGLKTAPTPSVLTAEQKKLKIACENAQIANPQDKIISTKTTLHGSLMDMDTGKALKGASVCAVDHETARQTSIKTDAQGKFTVDLPRCKFYDVVYSMPGYIPSTLSCGSEPLLTWSPQMWHSDALTKLMRADELKAALVWEKDPTDVYQKDLDMHMLVPGRRDVLLEEYKLRDMHTGKEHTLYRKPGKGSGSGASKLVKRDFNATDISKHIDIQDPPQHVYWDDTGSFGSYPFATYHDDHGSYLGEEHTGGPEMIHVVKKLPKKQYAIWVDCWSCDEVETPGGHDREITLTHKSLKDFKETKAQVKLYQGEELLACKQIGPSTKGAITTRWDVMLIQCLPGNTKCSVDAHDEFNKGYPPLDNTTVMWDIDLHDENPLPLLGHLIGGHA